NEQVSIFSNSSTLVKLLAPGENIKAPLPGGDFKTSSGTSMASPHVAGAFALARQKSPLASVPTILSALSMTGVKITDKRNNVVRPRIQIDAALNYLETAAPPNPIPLPPTELSATANSSSMITLRWKDNSNNESGFLIRRRTETEYGWSIIGRVSQGVTSFQHTSLRPGMTYYYSVIAFNPTGESEMSNEAPGRTPESGPAAPTRLTATVRGSSEIILNWQDNSNEESGYRIYRRRGNDDGWARLLTVGANLTSLRVEGLNPGMVYYFAISAVGRKGESALSNEVSTMTGLMPPAAPSALRAVPMSTTKISISWQDNSGNELGFRIRRRVGSAQSWSVIADVGANVTSYDDTGLEPGSTCYYLVTSINTAGESVLPTETMAVTLINDGISIPESPSELIAMAKSNSNVELQWIDNSTSEMGFQIWECAGTNSQWRLVAMVNADTTDFEREGLLAGQTYSYRIRSYNGAGESVESNQVTVMVPKMNFTPLGNNQSISHDINRFESLYFRIYAPVGVQQLTIETAGDGNVDLYLRAENQPNRLLFNCRSMRNGSNERCTIPLPQAGNWHILAYANYPMSSRFRISASYTMK
ncbi:MAG: fibronectin type III domain-containing protein, partial [Acidobacteriota bacterium]